MYKSNELKSVCHNLLGFLSNRNFDIDGYWGMGVLYENNSSIELAIEPQLSKSEFINIYKDQLILADILYDWFFSTSLYKEKLIRKFSSSINIKIEFNCCLNKDEIVFSQEMGDPYRLTIEIEKKHGRALSSSMLGRCFKRNEVPFKVFRRPPN